jgi:hypothetical protein
VVIGPRGVAATTTKGASQPGPTAVSIVSAAARAGFEVGSSSIPGAPVSKARFGRIRSSSGIPTRQAATAGRRSAAPAQTATREREGPAAARPRRPALIRSPSRASSGGTASVAIATEITVTTAVAVASESSSEPGWRKEEKTRATIRVPPANIVVLPAVARVASAASQGRRPAASCSRKRETISSE